MSFDRSHEVDVSSSSNGLLIDLFQENTIFWNKDGILPIFDNTYTISVDVWLVLLKDDGEWEDFVNLGSNLDNSGSFTSRRDRSLHSLCPSGDVCPVVVRIRVTSVEEMPSLTSLTNSISLWSGVHYYTRNTLTTDFAGLCSTWSMAQERQESIDALPACPPGVTQANTINSGFALQDLSSLLADTSYSSQWMDFFHPSAELCFVQSRSVKNNNIMLVAILHLE